MAIFQCALNLIALEVPLDERAMRLLDKEAMNLAQRPDNIRVSTCRGSCGAMRHSLDQAREADEVRCQPRPQRSRFLANRHEDSRAVLGQVKTHQKIALGRRGVEEIAEIYIGEDLPRPVGGGPTEYVGEVCDVDLCTCDEIRRKRGRNEHGGRCRRTNNIVPSISTSRSRG